MNRIEIISFSREGAVSAEGGKSARTANMAKLYEVIVASRIGHFEQSREYTVCHEIEILFILAFKAIGFLIQFDLYCFNMHFWKNFLFLLMSLAMVLKLN